MELGGVKGGRRGGGADGGIRTQTPDHNLAGASESHPIAGRADDAIAAGGGPRAEIRPGLHHSGRTGRHQQIHGDVEILREGLAVRATAAARGRQLHAAIIQASILQGLGNEADRVYARGGRKNGQIVVRAAASVGQVGAAQRTGGGVGPIEAIGNQYRAPHRAGGGTLYPQADRLAGCAAGECNHQRQAGACGQGRRKLDVDLNQADGSRRQAGELHHGRGAGGDPGEAAPVLAN